MIGWVVIGWVVIGKLLGHRGYAGKELLNPGKRGLRPRLLATTIVSGKAGLEIDEVSPAAKVRLNNDFSNGRVRLKDL